MIPFNTNQDASYGQLAALYNGNPNKTPDQVQSDLALNSGQASGYLADQGNKLGIGDPATYFSALRMQQQLAATPSGAQMEAARQAGQYAPGTLPAQLQQRDNMWNMVGAQNSAQSAQLATLQNQQADRQFPLPAPGNSPQLTPLEQQDAQSQGMTPMSYLLNKRLGPNRTLNNGQNSWIGGNTMGAADPQDLYLHPAFQRYMQQNPDKATQVFQALSGHSLDQFQQTYAASQQKQQIAKTSYLQSALQDGTARINPDTQKIEWRGLVPDPVKPGALMIGDKYAEGNPIQKDAEKMLPEVSSLNAERSKLTDQKASEMAQQNRVASLQMQKRGPVTAQDVQAQNTNQPGTFSNFAGGMAGDIGRMFTGNSTMMGDSNPQDFIKPEGVAPIHVAPELRNNPRFQQLMRTNPQVAHRMILAMQQRGTGDTSGVPAPAPMIPMGAPAY